jgi:hypothetical protein
MRAGVDVGATGVLVIEPVGTEVIRVGEAVMPADEVGVGGDTGTVLTVTTGSTVVPEDETV